MTDDLTEAQTIEQIEKLEFELQDATGDTHRILTVRLIDLRQHLTDLQFRQFIWRPIT